jgi:Polyketide cyclase / dehydrase and lipid transport
MYSIKVFIGIVISLIGFLCLFTAFLPSKVTVSKSIVIHATESRVASHVESFEQWQKWYPAFQQEAGTTASIQRSDSQTVRLTGEHHKQLTMHIVTTLPDTCTVLLTEDGSNDVTYQFILSPERTGGTLLTWNINTTLPWYPWKKITGIFLDKINGPRYAEVLEVLKSAVEKDQVPDASH